MNKISKAQLVAVVTDWGQGRLSTDGLQQWMLDHYDPDEVTIGEGEPEVVQEAMHIVMNEYELAKPDKILPAGHALALQFIDCDDSSFLQRRRQFLKEAFCD